jgi:hypothetical protein
LTHSSNKYESDLLNFKRTEHDEPCLGRKPADRAKRQQQPARQAGFVLSMYWRGIRAFFKPHQGGADGKGEGVL